MTRIASYEMARLRLVRPRRASFVLAALSACRSSDPRGDLRSALDDTVLKEDRRSEIAELLDARDAAQDEFALERDDILTRFRLANANFDASDDELAAILDGLDPVWEDYRDVVISNSLEMRTLLSAEEWAKIAERDVESMLAGPAGMR